MTNNEKEMISIGAVLRDHVPNPEDRERLIKTRDKFMLFISSLGPEYVYVINDYLEEIIVSFCMDSKYRGKHTIEFCFVCSLDEVRIEAKFKTPRLHDGTGGEESLACDLSMEVHKNGISAFRDDYDPESDNYIRWTIEIYPDEINLDEEEITEKMLLDSYNRLLEASTYISRNMESAYWQNYGISNISPDKTWRAHIEKDKWPYSYEIYDGKTNTGVRSFFTEYEYGYGEVYIDKHDTVSKVYIAHYYCYPRGPYEEAEDCRDTYEIEIDGDKFFIMDTTKSDEPRSIVICEGGRVTDTDFIYCNFKNHDDCNSTYIIEMNQNETTHIYELEEYGEFTEIAKIEKLDQTKPYIDIAETQMNANYKVSARFNDVERIAFIYAIQFLSIYRVEEI